MDIPKLNTAHFSIPGARTIQNIYTRASFAERSIAVFLALFFIASTLVILIDLNKAFTVTVPTHGGSLHEGIIGTPRFINPLLAVSDADRDVTELVYAGLLTAQPDGTFANELAENYTRSEDGLIYTFTVREDALFHDGEKVTADDVVFTINKTQDPTLKSPKRPNWEGVLVEKIDEQTIQFTLAQPYALFLENLTLGILPKHIWDTATSEQFAFSQFNLEPIGSGPYRIIDIQRNKAGVPETYTLASWKNYVLGEPYISRLILHFYPNEEVLRTAYAKGGIQTMSAIAPAYAAELQSQGVQVYTHPLPRIFAVFFNQNENSALTHREVRRALQESINTEALIDTVLSGYGTGITGPLPSRGSDIKETEIRIENAHALLANNGWTKNEDGVYEKKGELLSFTLKTANTPELKESALFLEHAWKSFGVDVRIELFDIGALNQEVIRPRAFEALLFGQIVGRTPDPFAFWHSSQRNDPGLNIALYTNITVDKIIEDIRVEYDMEKRAEFYTSFNDEVEGDQPAVFLYAPEFIYIVPETVRGNSLGIVTTPAERFLGIHEWYVRTDRVWTPFKK